jgi:hypothetical protein
MSELALGVPVAFPAELIAVAGVSQIFFMLHKVGVSLRCSDGSAKILRFVDFKRVLQRRRFQRQTALEIFLKSGKSYFVNFTQHESFAVLAQLAERIPADLEVFVQRGISSQLFAAMPFTEEWVNHEISSFEYLMRLNIFGGRSFNDVTQYPIFPWTIADLSSSYLNFEKQSTFRDLRKSMVGADETVLNAIMTENLAQHEQTFILNRYILTASDVFLYLSNLETFGTQCAEEKANTFSELFKRMSQSTSRYSETIPEFYTMPEIFPQNFEFPPWSHNSAFEFIYLQRKALESERVSQQLHHWIDLIWGVKRKSDQCFHAFRAELYPETPGQAQLLTESGIVAAALFQSPHPKRQPLARSLLNESVSVSLSSSNILFAEFHFQDTTRYSVVAVDDKGDLFRTVISFAPNSPKAKGRTARPSTPIPGFANLNFAGRLRPHRFCDLGDDLAIIDGASGSVWLTGSARRSVHVDETAILCLAADRDIFVSGGRDSILRVFSRAGANLLFSIPLYRGDISCAAVSVPFGLIACGTRDGFLMLCSLHRRLITRVIDLGGRRPSRLLITEAWGFVVLSSKAVVDGGVTHAIEVYNVNGGSIRRREIPRPVVAWAAWRSAAGFDYILFAGDQGKVMQCEVFWLDISNVPGSKVGPGIVAIRYARNELGIVIASRNGDALLLPFDHA